MDSLASDTEKITFPNETKSNQIDFSNTNASTLLKTNSFQIVKLFVRQPNPPTRKIFQLKVIDLFKLGK